jgi:hypothetical protein
MKTKLEEAAKIHAGIKLTTSIDEEERYYNSNVNKYDSFIAGATYQAERMFSAEEVENLLMQAWIHGQAQPDCHYTVRENWIKQTIKQQQKP